MDVITYVIEYVNHYSGLSFVYGVISSLSSAFTYHINCYIMSIECS